MNRPIDTLIKELESMFRFLNNTPLQNNEFQVVRKTEAEFENFLAAYRNPKIWISQNGQPNKIEGMTDEHLCNVIKLLDRQSDDANVRFQDYEIERYGNLQKEAFKRRLRRD